MILAIFQNERRGLSDADLSTVVVDQITQTGLNFFENPYPTTPPLFREDSFDPTTRIRRGRFYCLHKPLHPYDAQ